MKQAYKQTGKLPKDTRIADPKINHFEQSIFSHLVI